MAKTDKLDLHKEHKEEYVTPKTPALVEVGTAKYLAIEGKGAPGGDVFQAKVQAMYGTAFTIKMTRKFAGQDYKVSHLEALWWAEGRTWDFAEEPPEKWRWKLLIRVPEFITADDLLEAHRKLLEKGKGAEVEEVRMETIDEGPCVQVLHVGPYCEEAETVEAMRRFAEENDLSFCGLHHEIYLSDPRRVPPERLRTILRYPVRSS